MSTPTAYPSTRRTRCRPTRHRRDPRFSRGPALDIAAGLARPRLPAPVLTGADLPRMQQALFTLIHQETTR
jgi:hypothetical protein